MPATILDAFGNPAVYFGGARGGLYERTQDDMRLRPPQANMFDDYISNLSPNRWRSLVSESRSIGSRGILSAALSQKADYVSGSHWRPYFTGQDSAYGEQAEELLEDTNSVCCTRGPRYDWRTLWRLGVLSAGPDGGFFVLLTESPSGWPLLQPLEAHRIGQRTFGTAYVTSDDAWTTIRKDDGGIDQVSTPYVGLKIVNGIIYNKAGAEVAYRVLGATPDEDEDVSARDMIHVAAPRWFSEGRPIPQIAPALLDLLGVDLARTCQLDQQIIHSKLTLIEKNETGRQDPINAMLNPPATPQSRAGANPEVIERGGMRFVKNKGELTAHSSEVPSDQWMNYDMRMLASSIAAIGWRLEMLDPSALAGAATRAFQDQINTSILNCFEDMRHAVQRATRYRIAKFTKLGMLPVNKEFLKWNITPPPEFIVDRGAAKVDMELVRSGGDSMSNVHRRAGMRSKDVLNQQARYVYEKKQTAKKWSHNGIEVTPDELGTLAQPGDAMSNAAIIEANAEAEGNAPKTPDAQASRAEDRAQSREQHSQIMAALSKQTAPVINIAPPAIHITQPPINVQTPAVHVAPAAFHMAAPIVNVTLPKGGNKKLVHDEKGRISGVVEE